LRRLYYKRGGKKVSGDGGRFLTARDAEIYSRGEVRKMGSWVGRTREAIGGK